MELVRLEFDLDIFEALGDLLLGERIAEGQFREVFVCRLDRSLVVKVERFTGEFANVREWDVWEHVKQWSLMAKWFAPCKRISNCGKVLIQKRTVPLITVPKQLPHFFTDLKMMNFGKIGKQTVCHDYSMTMFIEIAIGRKLKMQKVRKDFVDKRESAF